MGFGSGSLDLMRAMFGKSEYQRAPVVPMLATQGLMTQSPYFGGVTSGSTAGIQDALRVDADLVARYIDSEDMDDTPLISSAYDLYADDSTQTDTQQGKSVWVTSEDGDVRSQLDNTLHKRLNIEEVVWQKMRALCKYGNEYTELVVKDGTGVIAANTLPPPTMRRIDIPKQYGYTGQDRQDLQEDTLGYVYDPRGLFKLSTEQFVQDLQARISGQTQSMFDSADGQKRDVAVMENWEVIHMRLKGKNLFSPYGNGVADSARWTWKRLCMLEDSIIQHRLSRAPSRFAFYVDVSGIPPQETQGYLNRVKQSLKKQNFVNPQTGQLDQKFNPLSAMDDFFMPVRDGKESTKVEMLNGPVYDHIEDVKFFENKIFAALKIPKPFLTYEETTAKTHLSAEDARFARTVLRIQREFRNGIKKLCRVDMAARGMNPNGIEFDIGMTIPSAIFELSQLEIRKAELELADAFGTWAPRYWIMTNVLKWSDDQIKEMERMRAQEEEKGDEAVPPSGNASGSIEQAMQGRGEFKTPSEPERRTPPTPPETASRRYDAERRLMEGVRRNTESIHERIEEMQRQNHKFASRWGEITGFLKEFQHALVKRR